MSRKYGAFTGLSSAESLAVQGREEADPVCSAGGAGRC